MRLSITRIGNFRAKPGENGKILFSMLVICLTKLKNLLSLGNVEKIYTKTNSKQTKRHMTMWMWSTIKFLRLPMIQLVNWARFTATINSMKTLLRLIKFRQTISWHCFTVKACLLVFTVICQILSSFSRTMRLICKISNLWFQIMRICKSSKITKSQVHLWLNRMARSRAI